MPLIFASFPCKNTTVFFSRGGKLLYNFALLESAFKNSTPSKLAAFNLYFVNIKPRIRSQRVLRQVFIHENCRVTDRIPDLTLEKL
jgi:hypothetical protein